MLDSRAPPGERGTYEEREAAAEAKIEEEAKRLMAETKLWRLANSALWIAWGIVQAHVPDMPDFEKQGRETDAEEAAAKPSQCGKGSKEAEELESVTLEMRVAAEKEEEFDEEAAEQQGEEEEEEFDYLAYAQERAMFAWGDAIQLGVVQLEDLPEQLRKAIKVVEY
jgi:choline kinase